MPGSQPVVPRTDIGEWATCVDRDRNLRFSYPRDWRLSDPREVEEASGTIILMSPPRLDGEQAVVAIGVARIAAGVSLADLADRHLHAQEARRNFVVRGRSEGLHPSGMSAIAMTFDLEWQGTPMRKEIILMGAGSEAVVTVTASCGYASRHEYREPFKRIFASVQLIDPARSATAAASLGTLGALTHAPESTAQMQRLWMIFDSTCQSLYSAVRMVAEKQGEPLGRAALFEVQSYLMFEMALTMLGMKYSVEPHQAVIAFFSLALTGEQSFGKAKGILGKCLADRMTLYGSISTKNYSPERASALAELLRTSGKDDVPRRVEPPKDVMKAIKYPTDWHTLVQCADLTTMSFRIAVVLLFKNTKDIQRLSVEEIDRRFDAAVREAAGKV